MSIIIGELAKQVRAARRAREWSQLELARRLGHRSEQWVWKFENGVVDADASARKKLTRILDLPNDSAA